MPTTFRRSALAAAALAFAAAPAFAASDAREAIYHAYQTMMQAKFASDITTMSGEHTRHSHVEYDTVDRIHLKSDQMEMIVLPEGTWIRKGGEWSKPPVDMSGMVKQFMPKSIDDMKASIKSASDAGMTTWSGKPVHEYDYSVDTTVMGFHVTSDNRIFVDADGRIVHSESTGEAMGQTSKTSQDIHYDPKIRITAPK